MQAFYLQQQAAAVLGATADQVPGLKLKLHYYPNLTQNSGESEETKRCAPASARGHLFPSAARVVCINK